MFVKLTNEADKHEGTPLIMSVDVIMTVFVQPDNDGKLATFICHKDGKTIWKIRETVDQVYNLIRDA